MHFFRIDRKHSQDKMAVLKEQETEMAQEILLGEAVTGVVNPVEDNRDREYTCNDKPTDQTVQSKIKSQQEGDHATYSFTQLTSN